MFRHPSEITRRIVGACLGVFLCSLCTPRNRPLESARLGRRLARCRGSEGDGVNFQANDKTRTRPAFGSE